jgi:UDP-N-acetylmuramoylalanine--D-glutamate ligase
LRFLIVGTEVSGRAALRLLAGRGHEVSMYDIRPGAASDLIGRAEVHAGAWEPEFLEGISTVVTSPGVPEHAEPLRDALAAGLPVWSELELGFRHLDAVPVAAVTGTNGKTTVTSLAAGMLQASGIRAAAVGNIGDPLCDAVDVGWEALVIEASSFQLRFIDSFHAEAAVLLNVAPDHLDWHGSFEAYRAAKSRIWERQHAGDALAYDVDDPEASRLVAGAPSRLVPVSGTHRPPGGLGPEAGALDLNGAVIDLGDLPSADAAFVVDVAAAAVVAGRLGAEPEAIVRAACSFLPAAHRREVVGEWNGVTWVDDSKATNPHAALAAIRAHGPVVLVAGGRNKGLDLGPIAEEPNVRYVIGLGEAGPEVVARAAQGMVAADLDEAVALADEAARAGDTVLLAPGCASFDMFDSYADRGERFAAAVRSRKEAAWRPR